MLKYKLEEIFNQLVSIQKNAYAKYSNYKVACIVDTDIGLVAGVNVENASYSLTVCAERNAINAAISQGAKTFYNLFLLAGDDYNFSSPCGACRQSIYEFFDPNADIYIFNKVGDNLKTTPNQLLPLAWNKDNLK